MALTDVGAKDPFDFADLELGTVKLASSPHLSQRLKTTALSQLMQVAKALLGKMLLQRIRSICICSETFQATHD